MLSVMRKAVMGMPLTDLITLIINVFVARKIRRLSNLEILGMHTT